MVLLAVLAVACGRSRVPVDAACDASTPLDGGRASFIPIGGIECNNLRFAEYMPLVACGSSSDPCDRCLDPEGRGPTLTIEGFDACAEAAAASGYARVDWSGAIDLTADCSGASLTEVATGARASIVWRGAAAPAAAIANLPPIGDLVAEAWIRPDGSCVTIAHVASGFDTTWWTVFATFPPQGGSVELTPTTLLTIASGGGEGRCDGTPGSWCAGFAGRDRDGVDPYPLHEGALPPCGTGALWPAYAPACGDPIQVAITVGQTECGGRIELAFVRETALFACH